MAAVIYPKWKQEVQQHAANSSLAGSVRAVAVKAGYVYSAAHQFLSDIAVSDRVHVFPALTGKTHVNGVFDADDADSSGSLAAGDTITAYVLFIDTGADATSRLVSYHDDLIGLPVTTIDSPLRLTWNAAGIFGL